MLKNPPAMRETWVQSLGWEDPLEKGKATHSVFWPGEFQGLYSPWGHKELDTTERLSLSLFTCIQKTENVVSIRATSSEKGFVINRMDHKL